VTKTIEEEIERLRRRARTVEENVRLDELSAQMAARPPIKIEHGIPMPSVSRAKYPKYPWREMAVGDSFLMTTDYTGYAHSLCNIASKRNKDGWRYIARKVGKGQYRIWRVS